MPTKKPKAITQKQLDTLLVKINNLTAELNTAYLEKQNEVECLIIGLIANENVCFVGPAGEAKSALTNSFTSLIGGKSFSYQVSAYTQPDNIMGIPSFKELRDNDRNILKTANMAPDADIVYLDECFKANNSMMNSLLLLLNEREVDIGEGVREKTNNRMIVGTSNEYPEDDELKAFWDRWVIRVHCSRLKKDSSFAALWNGAITGDIGKVDPKKGLSLKEVDLLRASIPVVDSNPIFQNVVQLRFELQKAGIELSSRRWVKIKKILHAVALRNGRLVSTKKDLKFLENCMWDDPSQKEIISNCISEAMGGDLNTAQKILAMARRLLQEISSANLPSGPAAIAVIAPKFSEIKTCVEEASKLDTSDYDVQYVVNQITDVKNQVGQLIQSRIG